MKPIILMMSLVSLTSSTIVNAGTNEYVQSDRYTLVRMNAIESQRSPLRTVITLSFGADVTTIGKAIEELLRGSGYKWVNEESVSMSQDDKSQSNMAINDQRLKQLPLPSVLRTLGPIRLHDALSVVVGEAWTLRVDELNRHIWFSVNADLDKHPTP